MKDSASGKLRKVINDQSQSQLEVMKIRLELSLE